MKKLLLSAILAVSAFAVSSVDAYREKAAKSSCSACQESQVPQCVKLVEAYEPACKNCVHEHTYTCPVGTTARFNNDNLNQAE